MSEEKPGSGWVKAYHPSGLLVTLPVTAEPMDYFGMFANVTALLGAGFLPSAPGVEAGEHKDEIGFVVKRSKQNEDGTETPIVDLYLADDAMSFALVSVYLNTPDQVANFERAASVKLDRLPLYIGSNKIERGAARQTDQLVVRVPKPFGVVWKDNPKYDPNETDAKKKKPKRLFVKWVGQTPPTQQGTPPTQQGTPPTTQPELPPQHAGAAKADTHANPGLRAAIAQMYAQCKSKADTMKVCERVVDDSRAGLLSEEDRQFLRPIATATFSRVGA